MKKICFLPLLLILSAPMLLAGNGDSPANCGCTYGNQVNIYAAGTASWVSGTQIKCTGETGTCWDLKYNGGWVLTIYLEPPVVFGSNRTEDNPPPAPAVVRTLDNYTVYQLDASVWKRK